MKALQFFGKNDLKFVDLPEPEIKDDEVLMKVKKVGICGTDLHIYNGGMHVSTPLVLGHEFVGDIVEVGKEVKNLKIGDMAVSEHVIGCGSCKYCREGRKNLCISPVVLGIHRPGSLAEYIVLPAELVYKLTDGLSYDEGVLVEPLSIAVYAVRKANVEAGDKVAVVGQGPIGLLVDFVTNASGGEVKGFDRHDQRIDFAKKNGFISEGFNIVNQNYKNEYLKSTPLGADIVFEAVGSQSSAELAFDLAGNGGKVIILGVFEHDVMINMMQIVKKELEVFGSWTSVFLFEETMSLMVSKKFETESFITHRYSFADAIKAFEESAMQKEGRIKTVIEF